MASSFPYATAAEQSIENLTLPCAGCVDVVVVDGVLAVEEVLGVDDLLDADDADEVFAWVVVVVVVLVLDFAVIVVVAAVVVIDAVFCVTDEADDVTAVRGAMLAPATVAVGAAACVSLAGTGNAGMEISSAISVIAAVVVSTVVSSAAAGAASLPQEGSSAANKTASTSNFFTYRSRPKSSRRTHNRRCSAASRAGL